MTTDDWIGFGLLICSIAMIAVGVFCIVHGWTLAACIWAGFGTYNAVRVGLELRRP